MTEKQLANEREITKPSSVQESDALSLDATTILRSGGKEKKFLGKLEILSHEMKGTNLEMYRRSESLTIGIKISRPQPYTFSDGAGDRLTLFQGVASYQPCRRMRSRAGSL